ncbi:hypothetical protein SNE40_009537 [Patella caerulea]|uniref:Uncharacterized protein n=1 Tax=Patella caerulea TaxID=87958 RepID=A0AAN8JSE0_PATCE
MVAAAKLIREEIRQREYTKLEYPNPYHLNDYDSLCGFLTPSLLKLLLTLMKNDLKMVSIGHAIVQCVRPRSVISPIMFGLGAEMDLVFGSRWLNEELYALGFSVSYDEVQTFKHSILQDPTLNCLSAAEKCPTHYVADNADCKVSTLDGKGTFHGLGLIRITKKKNRVDSVSERVKRLARVHVNELVKDRGIPVLSYVPCGPPALASVKFNPLIELKYPTTDLPILYYCNLLWQSSYLLKKSLSPEPHWLNWPGFMQHAFLRYDTVDEDDITILPLVDLDPGYMSTLYSCIKYIEGQIKSLNIDETTLTFDQPLYIKAEVIVSHENINSVVIRLGGFHTLMSAVGSVFTVMKGSGIEEALNCIYGPNAIVHIMSGKAIARALRSLFLLDATLSYKLMKIVISQIDQISSDPKLSKDDINELSGLLTEFYKKDDSEGMNMDFVLESSALEKLDCFMDKVKIELTMRSRTAKLWLLFQEYVGFIREFVGCERIKFFVGHLNATTNFLNLFAATGHAFYAKSARLYLQKMHDLPNTHPNLYAQYCNENTHAVQRNGLWTDLTIEQTLMSRLKGRGGLTHGRGLTESVRHMWIYTMHHFAEFHDAMTSLTGKRHKSSEQHTEFGEPRRARDTCDLTKLIAWFDKKDPFDLELTELMSLSARQHQL